MAQITLNSSGVASSGSLLLQTNGTTTQATLDTSGNLGLGVTPSAWNTFKGMQLVGGSLMSFSNAYVDLWQNSYYDGSNVRYVNTGYASYYRQNSGQHQWFTAASGTGGNVATFTQAMTLDASGNLLVGTTGAALSASGRGLIEVNGTSTGMLGLKANGSAIGYLACSTSLVELATNGAYPLTFTTNGAERARIDSDGNLLVGTTSNLGGLSGRVQISSGANRSIVLETNSNIRMQEFLVSGSTVGFISNNGTSTTYSTSSDYRLKENIAPMTGALVTVAQLKPVTYTWKVDGSDGQGFIAHELQAVVPECVTGEKDAVDENGNPVYQGIDTSFLVATLTAALQELNAKFEAYKAAHP